MPLALCRLVSASLLLGAAPALSVEPAGAERSIVRIVNHAQRGDWSSPWEATKVLEWHGSGFVVAGGMIMTNAHVVSDSRLLLVSLYNDPQAYVARVVHIAHDCDLALLRPEAPGILDGIPPLELGELPRLGSTVETLGYPVGGTQLSSTRGVVSRIEPQVYLHSGADLHLAVQTDAAINPGSSGGPVMQDGRVLGVAFQGSQQLENVGYFIADEVIRRFLADVEDGRYDGYPELGVEVDDMHNRALREWAGMGPEESGVQVRRVFPGTSAEGRIEEGDVILAVGDTSIANDGTVSDGEGRIPFGMLIDRVQVAQAVSLRLLRRGEHLELEIPLAGSPWADAQRNAYDRRPRYFVYAGLVFVALDLELLKIYGPDWQFDAPKTLLDALLRQPRFEPQRLLEERVVLLRRLTHPVNADMAWHREQVVDRVNGHAIRSLAALVDLLEHATGDFLVIEFDAARRFGVLDRRRAEAVNEEILERYGIHEDRNL